MNRLAEAGIEGKRVLLRVDFNVPMDKSGDIIDDTKIREGLPTIEYLRARGCRVIVASHLGRPKGKYNSSLTMDGVARRLSALINAPVRKVDDCIGPQVKAAIAEMKPGDVLFLENVRFHEGEEKNDPEFSRQLAELADVYVTDAFATAHRAHSSTAGVASYLPCYAGLLIEKEVDSLNKVFSHPGQPKVAIVGGAKVSDKLGLLRNFLDKLDVIIIGGGMANTFLKARGIDVGASLCEDGLAEEAGKILEEARAKNVRIMLPDDAVVSDHLGEDAVAREVLLEEIGPQDMILDIGPRSVEKFCQVIREAQTIVWNGPLGVYEYQQFARGTERVAMAVAESGAISVIGGGDSIATIYRLKLQDQITHISTGGGATLEYLEGLKLPGLVVCGCYD